MEYLYPQKLPKICPKIIEIVESGVEMFSIDVTENLIINLRKERGRGIDEIVEENREGTGAQIIS